MEQQKQLVLIVESQEDWLGILRQSFAKDEFDTVIARNYDEAVFALGSRAFNLAVVDPVLDGPIHQATDQNGQDGLQLLAKLLYEFPETKLVVVSGSVGREMLRNTRELPPTLPLVQKQAWDKTAFITLIRRVLDGASWGPPEPQIEQPADAAPLAVSPHINYAGL